MWTTYPQELHTVMLNKAQTLWRSEQEMIQEATITGLIMPNITITECTYTMQSL